MSRTDPRLAIVVATLVAWAPALSAQEAAVHWVAAANGVIPAGALAYGREADGRPQFPCRGDLAGGLHLGRIVSGATGCSVGYRGREITLADYQVLVRGLPGPAREAPRVAPLDRVAIRSAPLRQVAAIPLSPPTGGGTKRGFDENGRPYIEERLADGTIKRTQEAGVTLIKPDGTKQFIPNMSVRANAQPATPPDLPSDPRRGRVWVERHNEALLGLIRSMVHGDDGEMKKFSEGERKTAGDDLFAQIAYRTSVADFLAVEQ